MLLEMRNIRKTFPGVVALNQVNLQVQAGEIHAIVGENGAGKSTLMKVLSGVYPHGSYSGQILFDGQDITRLRPDQRARAGIGWVPQERNIFASLTVEENMTAVAQPGPWTAARVYEMFPRLAERRGNFGNQLSGGETQRMALARMIVKPRNLLLLDEPTASADIRGTSQIEKALLKYVDDNNCTLILSTHSPAQALRLVDEVLFLDEGRVIEQGSAEDVLHHPKHPVIQEFLDHWKI